VTSLNVVESVIYPNSAKTGHGVEESVSGRRRSYIIPSDRCIEEEFKQWI
jgi:hypothetical protein